MKKDYQYKCSACGHTGLSDEFDFLLGHRLCIKCCENFGPKMGVEKFDYGNQEERVNCPKCLDVATDIPCKYCGLVLVENSQVEIETQAPNTKTLRDEFAMYAMNSILANCDPNEFWSNNLEILARNAYDMADAMLEARKVKHD